MSNSSTLVRSLVIYGICVPLALFLGYMLGGLEDPLFLLSPGNSSFWMVGSILAVLVAPFFLKWHHAWVIASWNVSAVLFFAPGRPHFWMPLVGVARIIYFGFVVTASLALGMLFARAGLTAAMIAHAVTDLGILLVALRMRGAGVAW